jgi:hypothetical protein
MDANTGIISPILVNGAPIYGLVWVDKKGNIYKTKNYNVIQKVIFGIDNNFIDDSHGICIGSGSLSLDLQGGQPIGGNGNYNYVWLKSTSSATDGFTAIPSSNTMNFATGSITQNTWFKRCVVSDTIIDTSEAIAIKVNYAITNNTITSAQQPICANSLSLQIQASTPSGGDSSNYAYTWLQTYKSDSTGYLSFVNNNTQNCIYPWYLFANSWFKRVVSSGACIDTSAAFLISVKPFPQKPNISLVTNSLLKSTPADAYQWYKNDKIIIGATSQTLNISYNGSYTVKVDSNGCSNTSNKFSIFNASIDYLSDCKGVKIYPNPATSELHVETEGSEKLFLQLFDMTGKEASEPIQFTHSAHINTQDLFEGIYFLKITDENRTFVKTEKVMVLR